MSKALQCGCEPIGTVMVRKHDSGLTEWGYACKCGKVFKVHGSWIEKQPKASAIEECAPELPKGKDSHRQDATDNVRVSDRANVERTPDV